MKRLQDVAFAIAFVPFNWRLGFEAGDYDLAVQIGPFVVQVEW